jgi:hypothetical protein
VKALHYKREEVAGGWRNLYCLQNIIRMIKSRRMRWARHVYKISVSGMPRRRREDIRMVLGETG